MSAIAKYSLFSPACFRPSRLSAATLLSSALLAPPVMGQVLEEVIVTAQGREQSTPARVSTISPPGS